MSGISGSQNMRVSMALEVQPTKGIGEFQKLNKSTDQVRLSFKQLKTEILSLGKDIGGANADALARSVDRLAGGYRKAKGEVKELRSELAAAKKENDALFSSNLGMRQAARGGGMFSGLMGGGSSGFGGALMTRFAGPAAAIAGTYKLMSWLGAGAGNYSATQAGVPQGFAGPIERFPGEKWLSGIRDKFTGRDIRDRYEDFQIGQNDRNRSLTSGAEQERQAMDRMLLRANLRSPELRPGISSPTSELRALQVDGAFLGRANSQRGLQIEAMQARLSRGGLGVVERDDLAKTLKEKTDLQASANKELIQVRTQELSVVKQLSMQANQLVESKKREFVAMRPEDQDLAIEAATAYKAGKQLTFDQAEAFERLPVLQGLMRDANMKNFGDKAELFIKVGMDEEEKRFLDKLEQSGIKMGVEFDEQAATQQIRRILDASAGLFQSAVNRAIAGAQQVDRVTQEREWARQENFRD